VTAIFPERPAGIRVAAPPWAAARLKSQDRMGIDLWFDETGDSGSATKESGKYGAFGRRVLNRRHSSRFCKRALKRSFDAGDGLLRIRPCRVGY
jgi:hypothetical protein